MHRTCLTIDHSKQRYPTVGDYEIYELSNGLYSNFKVSDLDDEAMELLVLIHELIEEHLTRKRGLEEREILNFDLKFEEERQLGLHTEFEEPGDAENCPYFYEHQLATSVERYAARLIGVDWDEYGKKINEIE